MCTESCPKRKRNPCSISLLCVSLAIQLRNWALNYTLLNTSVFHLRHVLSWQLDSSLCRGSPVPFILSYSHCVGHLGDKKKEKCVTLNWVI
jgi:hypothetical protein